MSTDRRSFDWYYNRILIGLHANSGAQSVTELQEYFCRGKGFVRYWQEKYLDPALHSNTWGGKRNVKFTDSELEIVYELLFFLLTESADRKLVEYASAINELLHLPPNQQVYLCALCLVIKSSKFLQSILAGS